jgi:hypothetical protein
LGDINAHQFPGIDDNMAWPMETKTSMSISVMWTNVMSFAARKLSTGGRGDEKHDKAGVCCTLEKVKRVHSFFFHSKIIF